MMRVDRAELVDCPDCRGFSCRECSGSGFVPAWQATATSRWFWDSDRKEEEQ
jgi:hypothetical protein